MAWHVTESIDLYTEHVWDLLTSRADLNTVALTQITSARTETFWSSDEPTFAWWSHGGRTLGAVSLTPPYEMLLNVVPDGTLEELVAVLRRNRTSVPGVNGVPYTASRFAELWTAGTSLPTVLTRRMRLYGTTRIVGPDPAPAGRARLAREDEIDLIVHWYGAFGRELHDRLIDARPFVRERVAAGLAWLWEDADGTPASLAARHQPAAGVSRIGPVYILKLHACRAFCADTNGWVPVGYELEDRAHAEIEPGGRRRKPSFFLQLLSSHQLHYQVVIYKVQILQLVKTLVGIESAAFLAQKVENRLIENGDRKFYWWDRLAGRKISRAGFELEFYRLARLIGFFVGAAAYFNLLEPVLYLELRVTYAKDRFAKVFASRAKRLFNSWGHHHHADIKSGQVIGQNRDFD